MTVLILYATTEGQTRKIARNVQGYLAKRDMPSELMGFADAGQIDLSQYTGALLLASVHAGRYQQSLADFVSTHLTPLANLPHVFFSVSLSAAGDDPDDWAGLAHAVEVLTEATGWTPQKVEHVAGAFRFSEYNWFKTWAMRWIASQKKVDATGSDVEFTDWAALEQSVADWLTSHAA